jgi:hypothetical protein
VRASLHHWHRLTTRSRGDARHRAARRLGAESGSVW